MTAEEFVRKKFNISKWDSLDDVLTHDEIIYALVEFAKLKVQECKEVIHNNAYVEFIDDETGESFDYTDVLVVDKITAQVNPDSILNTYDLEDIK